MCSIEDVSGAVESVLSELQYHSGAIARQSAAITSTELFFSAASACPVNLVARNIAKLIHPIISRCGFSFAMAKAGHEKSMVDRCVDLVLSCVAETHSLRLQCDQIRNENANPEKGAMNEVRGENKQLRAQLQQDRAEYDSVIEEHLSTIESFLSKLTDTQLRLQQRDQETVSLFAEIDNLKEKLHGFERENTHLQQQARFHATQNDDRFLDELARANSLRDELAKVEQHCGDLKRENGLLQLQIEARNINHEVQAEEAAARVTLFSSISATHHSVVFFSPFQAIFQRCQMLQSQLIALREATSMSQYSGT